MRMSCGAWDTRPAENVATASIGEYQTLLSHMEGVDVVIHLAAALKSDSWPDLLRDNIVGTRNVYEASKAQGVRRVVFASSHQTTRLYEDDEPYVSVLAGRRPPDGMRPITVDLPFRSSGLFGTSKAFGEILGRAYADHYGLSVLCIRIVQVNRENRPHGPRWFSHDDVEQMVRRLYRGEGHQVRRLLWGLWQQPRCVGHLKRRARSRVPAAGQA